MVAHNRRGFGRSSQSLGGYDYDTFADDLATIFDVLDLKDAAQFGFSKGGGQVARSIGRHGTKRLSKTGLGGGGAPTDAEDVHEPSGTPLEAFDGIRAGVTADRAQFSPTWPNPTSTPIATAPKSRRARSTGSGSRRCRLRCRARSTASRRSPRRTSPRT